MIQKGMVIRGHYRKEEIEGLVRNNDIILTFEISFNEKFWIRISKGLIQVFWERVQTNEKISHKYLL